jgi:hypothetical protein
LETILKGKFPKADSTPNMFGIDSGIHILNWLREAGLSIDDLHAACRRMVTFNDALLEGQVATPSEMFLENMLTAMGSVGVGTVPEDSPLREGRDEKKMLSFFDAFNRFQFGPNESDCSSKKDYVIRCFDDIIRSFGLKKVTYLITIVQIFVMGNDIANNGQRFPKWILCAIRQSSLGTSDKSSAVILLKQMIEDLVEKQLPNQEDRSPVRFWLLSQAVNSSDKMSVVMKKLFDAMLEMKALDNSTVVLFVPHRLCKIDPDKIVVQQTFPRLISKLGKDGRMFFWDAAEKKYMPLTAELYVKACELGHSLWQAVSDVLKKTHENLPK